MKFIVKNSSFRAKNTAALIALTSPLFANAYCPIPSMTQNTYLNQQLQQQYQTCLSNEQFQQRQLEMQQEQLAIQRQQLQIQQQQQQNQFNKTPGQYIGNSPSEINWGLIK